MFGRLFYRLSQRYRQFMIGRYGSDELGLFLVVLSIILSFLARLFFWGFVLSFISWIILLWCISRMYSKNIAKRYEEKEKYLKIKNNFLAWSRVKKDAWRNRKTHKYFRCKNCRASIRVPRGVGKIRVSCPKCKKEMIKKV